MEPLAPFLVRVSKKGVIHFSPSITTWTFQRSTIIKLVIGFSFNVSGILLSGATGKSLALTNPRMMPRCLVWQQKPSAVATSPLQKLTTVCVALVGEKIVQGICGEDLIESLWGGESLWVPTNTPLLLATWSPSHTSLVWIWWQCWWKNN